MKLVKLFIVLSFFLNAGLLENTAHARSPAEVTKDLVKAADTAVLAYKETGMSGLIIKTQECYEQNTKNLFYCVYIDLASRRIDQVFVESMNFPPNEFFSDEQFGSRVVPVLASANMNMDVSNKYLMIVTPEINSLVEKKLYQSP